jgi:hypothetical protein
VCDGFLGKGRRRFDLFFLVLRFCFLRAHPPAAWPRFLFIGPEIGLDEEAWAAGRVVGSQ